MVELSASEGHLYFVAAQHILNILAISGEFPILSHLSFTTPPTQSRHWNLLFQVPLQLGPTDVTEALSNHQKFMRGFNLKEKKWESKASHGI